MWDTIFPYLLSGVSVGGQYALIAIGYTMVYGILRLINFAHGDVFMVAGIVMVYMAASGMPLWLCIPLVLLQRGGLPCVMYPIGLSDSLS